MGAGGAEAFFQEAALGEERAFLVQLRGRVVLGYDGICRYGLHDPAVGDGGIDGDEDAPTEGL